jgi:hypothetical protein
MTKEERRAEKIRVLVQSGSLFADAAHALATANNLTMENALQCVFVAEVTHELSSIESRLSGIEDAKDLVKAIGYVAGAISEQR